ncbi:conserved exported protein of unknown function [Nitrospira sp. KM1]|uniref:hypothetical protein n=1 Tax=Nitrospira sp. KM1 TaxID=1936990 RepID=UPI0013A7336A|nr:hypothetical protein [Nitrospira sp. KM1]BCA56247.1 conserved exported protein of unknown function [Nitrospira sp. KM1]
MYVRSAPVGMLVLLCSAGCNSDLPDPATTAVDELRAKVTLTRVATHPFLARFNLKLDVNVNEACSASADLFPDTGGVSRRNLYVRSDGRLYVIGQFDVRAFDAKQCQVSLVEFRSIQDGMRYLGTFDVDREKGWTFVPASVRPERLFEKL